METAGVPGALRERLGEEGTFGLVDLLDRTGRAWKVEVLETAGDRFARALAEESARIRTLIAEQGARLEARLAEQGARFDARLAEHGARLEAALAEQGARFDGRLAGQAAQFDGRLADLRAELLKWSFLFWIGQVAAMAALLAFMLRGLPR